MAFFRRSDYIVLPDDDYRLALARLTRALADTFTFATNQQAFMAGELAAVGYVAPCVWPHAAGHDEVPLTVLLGVFQEVRPYGFYLDAVSAWERMLEKEAIGHFSLWQSRDEKPLDQAAAIVAGPHEGDQYALACAGLGYHSAEALLICATRLCRIADDEYARRLTGISNNTRARDLLQALERAGHLSD